MSFRPFIRFFLGFCCVSRAPGITAGAWLASAILVAHSWNAAADDSLSPDQIFEKAQENYGSLSSYSDEGKIIATMDDDMTVTQFTIRLARTSFYRIEWQRYGASSLSTENSPPSAVWCSGSGNYLEAGRGVQGPVDRDIALANAAELSGGAAAAIPELFFNMQDRSEDAAWFSKRQADEKLADIDCFVIVRESQSGTAKTYWIGKQDFLIHQVRTVVNAQAMQAAFARAAKASPETAGSLHGFTLTETHTNIVLNPIFSKSDFVPSIPLFEDSDQE